MEQYHYSEGFEMVDWVWGSIITLKLRKFKVQWDGILHDLGREWRIGADIIMVSGGNVAEFLDPLIYFLKLLIENNISVMDLKAWLAGGR